MNYFNYSISAKKGKFYLKSAEPKEGYEKVTYGTDNKVTYHKYVDSVTGTVKGFEVKDVSFQGKTLRFLEVVVIDGENQHKISVNLKNTKGMYTDESRLLISAFYGMTEISEPVTITPRKNTFVNKKGEQKDALNLYVNYVNLKNEDGKGKSTGFIPFNEIPFGDKKEVAGDVTWDFTNQTIFFYEKYQEINARFAGATQTTPTESNTASQGTPKENNVTVEQPKASTTEEDEDDLPF